MRYQTHNRALRALSDKDFERVERVCRRVPLDFGQVLNVRGEPVQTIYFPESGVISIVAKFSGETAVEVANVGRESCTGFAPTLQHRTDFCTEVVQVPGHAQAMSAQDFNRIRREVPSFEAAMLANVPIFPLSEGASDDED